MIAGHSNMILEEVECGFMEMIRNSATHLYTFHSAKKIYFAKTPSKYMLMEKKVSCTNTKVLSLVSRNTVLISKEDGVLLFPKTN